MIRTTLLSFFLTLPTFSQAPVPDLEVLFYDNKMWEKPVSEVLKERAILGFRWLSIERKDARSMRSGLKLWQQNVGETILRSRDDKLHSFEISIYNRGDNGAIAYDDFKNKTDHWYQLINQQTGKEGEKLRRTQKGSVVSADRWVWKAPGTYLILNSSASKKDRKKLPEFLKLTLISVQYGKEIINSRGSMVAPTAKRKSLSANLIKKENGDTYIKGVPMVDQGRKGYCAVASAERVFRYYGLSVDQHAMAQIAQSSAKGGTSRRRMIESLKKVAGRTKTRLNIHYQIDQRKFLSEVKAYNRLAKKKNESNIFPIARNASYVSIQDFLTDCDAPTLREVRAQGNTYERFKKIIKEHIDQGVPLLWSLQVGVFKERGIPQAGGGHMRLIIGYNEKTDDIIYSDSWGAGHEFKRMKTANAYTPTMGLLTLRPSS